MASELQPLQLQLKDVYAIAQSIGEQFQTLIQQFGNSYLGEVVDSVVNALEYLETFVEDNQKLQARICKLLLNNDNLVKENEKLKVEAQRSATTLASSEIERKKQVLQLESLRETNNELQKQIEDTSYCSLEEKRGEDEDASVSVKKSTGVELDTQSDDAMELPRIRRRLAQMENELKRTRTKLLNTQSTMKCIVSENSVLKAELEESKAEIGLQTLQLTQSERVFSSHNHHESPQFFKKDLLIVLRERNELKEEVDSLRDELAMIQMQLRYQQQLNSTHGPDSARTRTNTKVRSIVTSITAESLKNVKRERKS